MDKSEHRAHKPRENGFSNFKLHVPLKVHAAMKASAFVRGKPLNVVYEEAALRYLKEERTQAALKKTAEIVRKTAERLGKSKSKF